MNIWEEGEGEQFITYTDDPDAPDGPGEKKKIIKAATLNKLVCKLTSATSFGTLSGRTLWRQAAVLRYRCCYCCCCCDAARQR